MTDLRKLLDRRRNGHSFHGERNGRAKLTWAQISAIRADTRKIAVIARAYGVGWTCISDVKTGKKWLTPDVARA